MTHAKPELLFQLADLRQTGRGGVRKGRKAALTSRKKITWLPAKRNAKLTQKAAEILHTSTSKAAGYFTSFLLSCDWFISFHTRNFAGNSRKEVQWSRIWAAAHTLTMLTGTLFSGATAESGLCCCTTPVPSSSRSCKEAECNQAFITVTQVSPNYRNLYQGLNFYFCSLGKEDPVLIWALFCLC